MNSPKQLLIGGILLTCLLSVGAVAASAAQSANGAANSANSGSNKTSNGNSQANGQGNQKDTTPGNNGLAKGHDKQLADLMQEFDACFIAGESGDVSGYTNAARLLMAGDKDFTNLDSAMAILDKAIKLGSPEAKYLKGALLIGQETNVSIGLNYIMEAARADYPDAQLLLARLYQEGKYVPRDDKAAAEWAKYAADIGLTSAKVDLARLTMKKSAGAGEVDTTALVRLMDAAANNNAQAALQLSTIYLKKVPRTPDDYEAAHKYAQIAYNNGMARGAFLIAECCLPDEPEAALDWLEKGRARDDWKSWYALDLITKGGMSVTEAVIKAAKSSRDEAMNYDVSVSSANRTKSTPVAILSSVAPTIPAALRGMDLQVEIELQFTVGKDGIPVDIQVLNPSAYEVLNTSAIEALAKWRFQPATKNGVPIPKQATLPIRFKSAR